MRKIVFVSEMKVGSEKATSTDIMTDNLITGIKKAGYQIELIAICEEPEFKSGIKHYYHNQINCIHLVDSVFGKYRTWYIHLYRLLKNTLFKKKYAKRIPVGIDFSDAVLISHAPSLESVFLCSQIIKKHPEVKYYQYWSDPVALSGITPEQYGYKRWPFWWVESQALKYAEKVTYGTKILMEHQKELFPQYSHKMNYIDISYKSFLGNEVLDPVVADNVFLYAGGYYSAIRNIQPLFAAVEHMDNVFLDVYGSGDVSPNDPNKIRIHGQVSPQTIAKEETKYRNVICLVNSSCIQVPGKLFYGMNLKQNILVILDGPYAWEIKAYLETYKRFCFCENTEDSIRKAILEIRKAVPHNEEAINGYSPEIIAEALIASFKN